MIRAERLIENFEKIVVAALVAAAMWVQSPAKAMDAGISDSNLRDELSRAIGKQYPGAKIVLDPAIHWTHGSPTDDFRSLSILGETSRGETMFAVEGADGERSSDGWVGFAAWMPAKVAVRRVFPGDRVSADMFTVQNVNVAAGQAHELRGVIYDAEARVSESRSAPNRA